MLLSSRLCVDAAQTAKMVQPDKGKNLFTKAQHFTLVHPMNLWIGDARNLHYGRERYGEKTASYAEEQGLNTCKSKRRAKLNRGTAA